MLRLRKIEVGKRFAEADFIPEDSPDTGHIVVDLRTGEVVSCIEVPGYGASYRAHARQRLIRIANEGDVCTECIVMWY